MVSTKPTFFTAIKNATRSDQDFINLIADMVTTNPVFSGPIAVRIAVYADDYPTMLGVRASPAKSVTHSVAQSV